MLSRRVFLRNGGLALVSLGFAPSFLTRTVAAAGTMRRKLLIAIFQRGAMDGLNVVVPFGEKSYYQARPSIAIARPGSGSDAAVDLDGFFAFHPRLASLKPLYDARRLAIVHACGSPDSTRSHFDAQDYFETATPGVKSTEDGWLNRYLQARGSQANQETAFRAVAVGPQLPRALKGRAPALAMNRLAQFDVRGNGPMGTSFEAQYKAAADVVLNGAGREAFEAIRTLKAADPERYRPERGAEYPPSAYGQALRQIAQLAKADVGLEVAFAESNGWDHHVNEGGATGQLALRLDDFARGLAALVTDLGDRLDDTVILTMSEFGRAVAENGNRGTDHGHGNAMLVLGGAVNGGRIYGTWPGLARDQRFEGRDLAITTDFRDVFGEIVVRHLGISDPRPIFPGYDIRPARFAGFLT
jgi:uncharacterized protein (DUF1501 family)